MSAESPRHARSGGPLTVPSQPPSDRSIIDAVSGFINDVTLSSSSSVDPKDVIQWARFETADINEPTPEGDSDNDISPLLLILGYGSGVQVWLIPPNGEAQEVLSWRQGIVRVLRILPTPQHGDCYASKRPLIALCDSASPGPTFCSLSFISIRGGEQVKHIKFKNPILDVLANKRSVVVSFSERFAVFDAATLEDRMTVTTCYPCPCPLGGNMYINPLALGERWLAYAEKKLNPSKRSSGGCEGEGVTSYTATVLHAAKSLSKGLRGLGESVAHSLAGGRSTSQSPSPPNADMQQPGIVTILDVEGNEDEDGQDTEEPYDPIVAHFVAHSEAIIAMKFDPSGMLLVTADRRGHDFHVFRINPHPCGSSLASVHHLYILHRGDTTAKVQDIAISGDSRWAAISTLRGTTHVFAVSPYGGACGVRTHTQPRVVNRLSRFHRSAGLPIHAAAAAAAAAATHAAARSGSPVGEGIAQGAWYPNPRLPPYPLPTTVAPLAQLRPTANLPTHTITRTSSGRQRLSSLSEEGASAAPLLARARFGLATPAGPRAPPHPALYLMAASGNLLHLVLHPRPARSVPKEKICDESPIELDVEAVAQWPLQRPPAAADLLAPLPPSNPLLQPLSCRRCSDMCMSEEERWLSQVEIVTHAGPHRRLWMGPQFVFKTYNCTGSNSSLSEAEAVEIDTSVARGMARSNPVNMPGVRPVVPVLIDSGSASSLEHSPSDSFRRKSLAADGARASVCDVQLREDLAEAMKEDHGWPREETGEAREARAGRRSAGVVRAVDPLGTVVAPPPAPAVERHDPDLYTHSNADEATFRPVVRAPAPLAFRPDVLVRPLPDRHAIPVETGAPLPLLPDLPDLHALATHVLIPAALTDGPWNRPDPVDRVQNLDRSDVLEEHLHRESVQTSEDVMNQAATEVNEPDLDVKKSVVNNEDLKRKQNGACKRDSTHETSSVPLAERESENVETLPKSNRRSDDIQPTAIVRVKKSPTSKSDSDRDVCDVSFKNNIYESVEMAETKESKEIKEVKREDKEIKKEAKETKKEAKETKREAKGTKRDSKEKELKEVKALKMVNDSESIVKHDRENVIDKGSTVTMNEEASVEVTLKLPTKKDSSVSKSKVTDNIEIKTEEQAWDLLLNDSQKPIIAHNVLEQTSGVERTTEDLKVKQRRNRKTKKQDDTEVKLGEDSFVEIHAIEEKQQLSSGELVSISTAFEDVELNPGLSKGKKSRSSRSYTPERNNDSERKPIDILSTEDIELNSKKSKSLKKYINVSSDVEFVPELCDHTIKLEKRTKENVDIDTFDIKITRSNEKTDETTLAVKELLKPKKSKSLSPYTENTHKSLDKSFGTDKKDVYFIDTSKEDFPEIQITRGKPRKKSPQPLERKSQEHVIEKPFKSWSSIAATKTVKKLEDLEKKNDPLIKKEKVEKIDGLRNLITSSDDNAKSSSETFHDKLIELCKRTDIVVAECDAPSELNFVEEHHSVMADLPPLEPLGFGLNDFNLDVMRDSLLETTDTKLTSPICKINIDDILSSIKDTTSKVVESSMFNLVDLEKMPSLKEKGFSVIESHKITTQEIKIDDDLKSDKETEVMDKSSDDDVASPVLSTDSDREDKRNTGASSLVQPSSKQSAKSKKSRRKKK